MSFADPSIVCRRKDGFLLSCFSVHTVFLENEGASIRYLSFDDETGDKTVNSSRFRYNVFPFQ